MKNALIPMLGAAFRSAAQVANMASAGRYIMACAGNRMAAFYRRSLGG